MISINTPIDNETVKNLKLGDMIKVSGYIYTARDAVLPKLVDLIKSNRLNNYNIILEGSVIFHTAVSPAGIGPTSSNKLEIESNIPFLSKHGVKMHLGKGALKNDTIHELKNYNSFYATIPPVTALLESKIISKKIIAFEEEGMEALHLLEIVEFPIIVAAIHGKSLHNGDVTNE